MCLLWKLSSFHQCYYSLRVTFCIALLPITHRLLTIKFTGHNQSNLALSHIILFRVKEIFLFLVKLMLSDSMLVLERIYPIIPYIDFLMFKEWMVWLRFRKFSPSFFPPSPLALCLSCPFSICNISGSTLLLFL